MTRTLKLVGLSFGLCVFASLSAADDAKKADEKDAALKLEGGYTIVSGERDGKPIPEERIKGAIVKFTGDTIVGTDKDKKEFFASKYKLDTGKKPYKIWMKSTTPSEAETTGLVEKDGDTVKIVYALPGGKEPTEMKAGEKQHLFVLKNMNKEKRDK